MKCLAIIPARGGSKGTPKKNLKLVPGSVLCAEKSGLFDRIVVSSDDEEILKLSLWGQERPACLAEDDTRMADVVSYVLLRNQSFDMACLLQPTSPKRTQRHVLDAYEIASREECACYSVVRAIRPPQKAVRIVDGVVEARPECFENRQAFEPAWYFNGAVYWFYVQQWRGDFGAMKIVPYEMTWEESDDVD